VKRTYQPNKRRRAKRHGFRHRMATRAGQAILKARLAAEKKRTVYETLERPLVKVLADMEFAGVAIDSALLRRLSNDFASSMAKLELRIHELAGKSFNVGSPKQLGDILFGKFALPGGRKTRTGAWSTDADVLEEVALAGHEIAQLVLDWRQLQKLRSTYTDALPAYVNPRTGRVHTSYAMASTSTGRLAFSLSVKRVNHRVLDLPFRLPSGTDALEMQLRVLLKDRLARGHVDGSFRLERTSSETV